MNCKRLRLAIALTLALFLSGSLLLALDIVSWGQVADDSTAGLANPPGKLGGAGEPGQSLGISWPYRGSAGGQARGELLADTTFSPADNPHVIADDLIVPAGVTLTVEPGVELRFAPQASLLVYGCLRAVGSLTRPITFTWRDEGVYWGAIAILNSSADNQLTHALIEHSGEEADTSPRNYGVTVRAGRLTIADSIIRDTANQGIMAEDDATLYLLRSEIHHTQGDALHASGGRLIIQGNHVHDNDYEGLSLNDVPPDFPAVVSDNHIHHVADDCLDLNKASATIERNRLHHCGDKGVSIGAILGQLPVDSSTTLVNNLIYSNSIGIAVKDSAVSHLVNNTVVGNQAQGLWLYEDHDGYGGGQATLVNTILWGNGVNVALDISSSVTATFSLLGGGWPGQGNLDADPLFLPGGDYRLTQASPCRDAGSAAAAPPADLDGLRRSIGAAPDVGACEWPPLRLSARSADATVYLGWRTVFSPTSAASYAIHYATLNPGSNLITSLPTTTLSYTLTGLINDIEHTFTLELLDSEGEVLLRSNSVVVLPTDQFVYLPLVLAHQFPKPVLYEMTVDPDDLLWLVEQGRENGTVAAQFVHEGLVYDVQTRFRGEIARWLPKKSWKVQFDSSFMFQERREINLNAEYPDKSLLREWLGYDLFERVGLIAPRANLTQLYVNGDYWGLFTEVEQVDQRFLHAVGLDPNGNLYKGDYGSFHLASSPQEYEEQYIKKTNKEDSHADIMAFVELINDPQMRPADLADVMDVGTYLDWYAVQTLLGNFEWVEKKLLRLPRPAERPLALYPLGPGPEPGTQSHRHGARRGHQLGQPH